MKKIQVLALGLCLSAGAVSYAQHVEAAPFVNRPAGTENTNALFDPLFNYDLTAQIGASGNAGVVFINGEFWISAWASDLIHVLDNNGMYLETFSLSGLTGTRSLTTDGTYVYAGTASNLIYEIDPITRNLENTIGIAATSDALARMLAYDPTLDGGNGGFWTASFSSDIEAFDMNGGSLQVIPYANHGHAIYGGAVDHYSDGGPYLWLHSQGTTNGQSQVVQLSLATGQLTGVLYDYNTSDSSLQEIHLSLVVCLSQMNFMQILWLLWG